MNFLRKINRLAMESVRASSLGFGATLLLFLAIAGLIGALEFPLTGVAPWNGALAYLTEVAGSPNAGAEIVGTGGLLALLVIPWLLAGIIQWSLWQVVGLDYGRWRALAAKFIPAGWLTAVGRPPLPIIGSALLPHARPLRTAAYTAAHLSGAAPRLE